VCVCVRVKNAGECRVHLKTSTVMESDPKNCIFEQDVLCVFISIVFLCIFISVCPFLLHYNSGNTPLGPRH